MQKSKQKPTTATPPTPRLPAIMPLSPVLPEPTDEMKAALMEELKMLNGRLDEYLKCCLILGYNMDGIPIQIVSAKNQQDIDSLNILLQKFLMNQGHPPDAPAHNETV